MSHMCRICREENNNLIECCQCIGSVAWVHFDCLKHWIQKSGRIKCDLCRQEYKGITITLKHKSILSFINRKPLVYTIVFSLYLLIYASAFALCLFANKSVDYYLAIGLTIGNTIGFCYHIVIVTLKDFNVWKNSGEGADIDVVTD